MIEELTSFPATLASSFSLIGLAEIGDKSQIVCMTLAARYRVWPVLLGAIAAFAVLNLAAVLFGAAVAHWLPQQMILALVGLLFLVFGIHAFRSHPDDDDETIDQPAGHGIFFSTLLLIFLAEFGDKTQIAVAGLSTTANLAAVWIGSTLALTATSSLGVWAGRTVLQRMPITLLHRVSGSLFILLGVIALAGLL